MYDRKICTGDDKQINDALESFPSGHSTAAVRYEFYQSSIHAILLTSLRPSGLALPSSTFT